MRDIIKYDSIDRFTKSAYNPRESSEERLSMLETSIRAMGFIMPMYIDENNIVLSGHQRLTIAKRLGIKEVPYCVVTGLNDHEKKMFNIMFNAGTNDFYENETNENIVSGVDLTVDPKIKPAEKIEIEYLSRDELRKYEVKSTCKGGGAITGLMRKGVYLPIVLAGDKIVNGNGRFLIYQRFQKEIPVIRIPVEMADLAKNALNKISMEFSINDEIRPFIRYSAYRRLRQTRGNTGLGTNFKYWSKHQNGADITPKFAQKFKSIHGETIINFGAGDLSENIYLDRLGVRHIDFEPYICGRGADMVNIEKSKAVCKEFLKQMKESPKVDSVFLNYILNSIGTWGDMDAVLKIIGLFDSGGTKYWISAKSKKAPKYLEAVGKRNIFQNGSNNAFEISENEVISTAGGKVQRYFDPLEYKQLLQKYFDEVRLSVDGFNLYAYCTNPKQFQRQDYDKAIELEFELDYPDGTTMGLSDLAKSTFSLEKEQK